MVISHKYRYLFIELPKTGSSAIHHELIKKYEGKRILQKHSLYHHFLRVASPEEKRYFVFSTIRNPLDETVSRYFGYKMDWQLGFRNLKAANRRHLVSRYHERRYSYIHENEADFPAYFRRFCRLPYSNASSLAHDRFDFILRFEHLANDFEELLQILNIAQIRPLPRENVTPGRSEDFLSYYVPSIRERARYVFGPFMNRWGYEFPDEWGDSTVSRFAWYNFRLINLVRKIYWKHFYLHQRLDLAVRNRRKNLLP